MEDFSFLTTTAPEIIDELYTRYQKNPLSVEDSWRSFFSGYTYGIEGKEYCNRNCTIVQGEEKVMKLITGYRQRGHLFTKTNPVRERRTYKPPLTLELFGLKAADLKTVFQAGKEIGIGPASLEDIIKHLEKTYCDHLGVEYLYLREPEIVTWLQKKMESVKNTPDFTSEQRELILKNLTRAVLFEQFLDKKFIAQKRFSLEGVEAVVPALNTVIDFGADLGIEYFAIGMAHRGRLNVLANVVGKPYEKIFFEYKGIGLEESQFVGDVKYHLGYSQQRKTIGGKEVHISLHMNPSHLEAVAPLVMGKVRSKLDFRYRGDQNKAVSIIIHGDAAIAGQGVVYELVQMSQLDGYKTGGSIHIILNNQVGFTTNYKDARSSTYCTDIAKVTLSPVFHVNGDDIEEVVYAVKLAIEFRQQFHRDVFIDILGYRKHGHNEGDEPRFTQPTLYNLIANHPNPLDIYTQALKAGDSVPDNIPQQLREEVSDQLNRCLNAANTKNKSELPQIMTASPWQGFRQAFESDFTVSPITGISKPILEDLIQKIHYLPDQFPFFGKTKKLFTERVKTSLEKGSIDWALGELLAYASLLIEGFPVRLSGQDCGRGTFSHRHAIVTIEDSEEKYIPLQHIGPKQAQFEVYNSLLSEYGVLGFEAGYAYDEPNCLTIWEAQFGDFANVAQVIFDQFLASSEAKWYRSCGLVVYLPHGYEGQGSEHSSARIERFLTLVANNNIQVVNCTTPANFFHVLRRQMVRPFRKPLIVMTPKSLLRHPACVSRFDDCVEKTMFTELYDDETANPAKVKRVLLCSGKMYYDLFEKKTKDQRDEVALLRIEQLYPFPLHRLQELLNKYVNAHEIYWVQEEPENMGAWPFILRKLKSLPIQVVCRKECGTTATGFSTQHVVEQKQCIEKAFA